MFPLNINFITQLIINNHKSIPNHLIVKPLFTMHFFIGFFNIFLFLTNNFHFSYNTMRLKFIFNIRKLTSYFNNRNAINRLILKRYTKYFFYYIFNTFNPNNHMLYNYANNLNSFFTTYTNTGTTQTINNFFIPYNYSYN